MHLEQDMSFSLSGETVIRIDYTSWVKPVSHTLAGWQGPQESPFTLSGDKLRSFHKSHGPASSQDMPV
jgi:hypothetical protein